MSITRVGAETGAGNTCMPSCRASAQKRSPVSPPRGHTANASAPSAESTRATFTPLPPVCHSSRVGGRPKSPTQAVRSRQGLSVKVTISMLSL